ncbi:MAG: cysteine--tRNA ligase [Eubacteriales bacterium]|nr:cysteine--tRNA ligase [Eubacteriales bacterium]
MRIYNTQTRQKEDFVPLEPGKVKIYVCGPTVYNYFHLGNARPFITYDTLRRYFEYRGYVVTYVQNFTDIDDKMITRANQEGISTDELAQRFIDAYYQDADQLNIRRADHHPRATRTIPMIIELVQLLVDRGYAYTASDGVYFDVARYANYGKLSHHRLEDLLAGASDRLTDLSDKKSSADFALWKFKKEGEPSWESPWGEGRPGWHIECSAMVRQYLGDTIDIHGGGQDLVFPHHENEIAQSEAATGKPFVRYWMHNGFINIDHAKMSKSSGNFFTVRDLARHFDHQVLRFFMLSGHYRMPINFSTDLLHAAENGWKRIVNCLENIRFLAQSAPEKSDEPAVRTASSALRDAAVTAGEAFIEAMDDDLNTADGLAAVFDLVRLVNITVADSVAERSALLAAADKINELLDVLGLYPETEQQVPQTILDLLAERTEAKKARDFARADALRDKIQSEGFVIEDTPQGPKVTPR